MKSGVEVTFGLKNGSKLSLTIESKAMEKLKALDKKISGKIESLNLKNQIENVQSKVKDEINKYSPDAQLKKYVKMAESTSIGKGIKRYKKLVKEMNKINEVSEKAVKRTVSDVNSRAAAQVKKAVMEVYGVKASYMTEAGREARSRATVQEGKIQFPYQGTPLSPLAFQMKPATRAQSQGKLVSAAIRKGERKVLGSNVFLGNNGSGTDIPFQRAGEKRLPINSVKTVSIPQMITNEEVAPNIQERLDTLVAERLEHNLKQASK